MNGFKKEQFARLGLIIVISAIILFIFLKIFVRHEDSLKSISEPALSVTTQVAQMISMPRQMIFSGQVVGRDEVAIYSELNQGRIDKVLVEAGQHVKAGTVLATIDVAYLRIQKAQQKANLQRASLAIKQQQNAFSAAQVQYSQAQVERKRGDLVAESGLISKEVRDQRITNEKLAKTHLEEIKDSLGMAKADFDLAAAQLAESDLRLDQAAIRSPVSGMIIDRKALTGMSLAQNTEPLFMVLRDDDIEIELEIPADEATRLKEGVPVTIQMVGDLSARVQQNPHPVDEVLTTVKDWSNAWMHKDIDSYLSFYDETYEPEGGISKAAWTEQRKKRLGSKGSIEISLSKVNVKIDGDTATEEFLQQYTANGRKEEDKKRLTLKFVNGKWVIKREQILASFDTNQVEESSSETTPNTNIYKGKISRAATQINPQNQIAKVKVRFDKTPNLILGQIAQVSVTSVSASAIYLSDTAVRFEGDAAYIYTVKSGLAKRLQVKVGQRIGNKLEILDGVSPGLLVIDSAASFLRDNEPVRVLKRPAK